MASSTQSVLSRILVLNAGSSSLKFKLFDQTPKGLVPGFGGLLERIGDVENSTLVTKGPTANGDIKKTETRVQAADHVGAMSYVIDFLNTNVSKNIMKEVKAVGHRVVHGLDINKPALLTDQVIDTIKRAAALAPLHNPPGLQGITASMSVFGDHTPQVAVFDTAYHQSMPAKAFMYALPYELYEKHQIRKYGFHGTSHQFLVNQAADMLNMPVDKVNAISCHLGAGSSIAAVQGGKSIDTTMGMTPLEGLVMATRCGDMDPAVVLHLQRALKMTPAQVDTLMNKQSGLLGLAGSADLRGILAMYANKEPKGTLALEMLVYRVRKYIGAYTAALDGDVNALLFSAGIGENSALARSLICSGLTKFGVKLNPDANQKAVGVQADISAPDSKVKVFVIPTDEELGIAQQTASLLGGKF